MSTSSEERAQRARGSLVIIPTYNEVGTIISLVNRLWEVCPLLGGILIIDDASPDGTAEQVLQYRLKESRLHLLSRPRKLGLGTAYVAGFQWGLERGYQTLIQMDADFSHPPEKLPLLLEGFSGVDFVIGSRAVPGGGTVHWGWGRRLLSRAGSFYARKLLGVRILDFTGGFNGWSRNVLEAIGMHRLTSQGYSFQIELKYRAAQAGFRWKEFPIQFEDRRVGQSKMGKAIIWEALRQVWALRFSPSQNRRGE